MSTVAPANKLCGLARTLIQEKSLSEEEAHAIQAKAATANIPFLTQLIASKRLSAADIAETSAKAFGFPYFNLDSFNADYLPSKKLIFS